MSITRFTPKYTISNNGCWEWIAGKTKDGYGIFWDGNKMVYAHRWSYEYFVDKIKDGLHIDHLCRVRNCVNPNHMEPVTLVENIKRGDHTNFGRNQRIKTHCPQGHEYNKENTYIKNTKGRGRTRVCATCAKKYAKEKYWSLKK